MKRESRGAVLERQHWKRADHEEAHSDKQDDGRHEHTDTARQARPGLAGEGADIVWLTC